MKVFPTLNIQNGCVVPTLGAHAHEMRATEILDRFLALGFQRIALVDVDAAQGTGNNRELLGGLLARCRQRPHPPCVQVAGGIRSSDQAQYFLDHGAQWLVVGTILHKSPLVVDQLLARFQRHLTAAIDARRGEVRYSGWSEKAPLDAAALADQAVETGFRRLLFIDIPGHCEADPDFATARTLGEPTRLPLVMGGSLLSKHHLAEAAAVPGLHGVLVDALLMLEDPRLAEHVPPTCA